MKDWKYILYVSLAIAVFVGIKLISPKQYNWTVTFAAEDKNPYGAYILSELLPSIFPDAEIEHSHQTLYEIKDSLAREGAILILCSRFHPEEADTKALLNFIDHGGTGFISAQHFWGYLPDTLGFSASGYFYKYGNLLNRGDTSHLKFASPSLDTTRRYSFRRDDVPNYFVKFDSLTTTVVARNEHDLPVTLRIKVGKGDLYVNSTPFVFTNIYMLSGENNRFASGLLSYLPVQKIQWTEYYQSGRREVRSPLRFILTTEPLKWAYYITLCAVILFIVFEMKRKQRVIPVIKAPENTTVQFVTTIGNLYYQNREHRNIAEKKILFLLDQLRTKYRLSTTRLDDEFVRTLSKKTGRSEEDIRNLIQIINQVRSQDSIDQELLIKLNAQIEKCRL
jgi:hypothetical protein